MTEGPMRLVLFTAFTAIPLVEIALLVLLGRWIGFWATMGIIVGTAIIGTMVLHRQGFAVMERTMAAINAGKPPIGPVVDGGFLLLAGMLLITPGLITDSLGLLLLVPWVRRRIAAASVRRILRSQTFKEATAAGRPFEEPRPRPAPPGDGPVIDGEFERLDERAPRRQPPGQGPSARP
jgi:UPF0716 protein FxsA